MSVFYLQYELTRALERGDDSASGSLVFEISETNRHRVPLLYEDIDYLRLAEAIRTGQRAEPDFASAVERHKLLETIQAASDQGRRVPVGSTEG